MLSSSPFPLMIQKINKEFPINFSPDGKIYICPLAGWKAKEWGIEKFGELSGITKSKL